MLHLKTFFNAYTYVTCLIALTAMIGDFLVSHTRLQLYRSVFDNVTHAVIGGLSWFLVVLQYRSRFASDNVLEIIVATLISSFIDLDHFIAAKSLQLKDAVNLQHRPFLHCSTIPIIVSVLLFFIGFYGNAKAIQRYALLLFISFASHHTRDATRRGYWFYPFGSTRPILYYAYISLTCLLPYLVILVLMSVYSKKYRDPTIDI